MARFDDIYGRLKTREGYYVWNPNDKGGETYMGISRVNNPDWEGWERVDEEKRKLGRTLLEWNYHINDPKLDESVKEYFRRNYWDALGISNIKDPSVQESLFDYAVLSKNSSAQHIKKILRDNYHLPVKNTNGNWDPWVIEQINNIKDQEGFFNVVRDKRLAHYDNIVEKDPSQEEHLKSWKNRVNSITYQKPKGEASEGAVSPGVIQLSRQLDEDTAGDIGEPVGNVKLNINTSTGAAQKPTIDKLRKFDDIINEAFGENASESAIAQAARESGYNRATVRNIIQGYRKYKRKGADFEFNPDGTYRITAPSGQGLSNSGRRKGQSTKASAVAQFLGRGKDVSTFAGFLQDVQKKKASELEQQREAEVKALDESLANEPGLTASDLGIDNEVQAQLNSVPNEVGSPKSNESGKPAVSPQAPQTPANSPTANESNVPAEDNASNMAEPLPKSPGPVSVGQANPFAQAYYNYSQMPTTLIEGPVIDREAALNNLEKDGSALSNFMHGLIFSPEEDEEYVKSRDKKLVEIFNTPLTTYVARYNKLFDRPWDIKKWTIERQRQRFKNEGVEDKYLTDDNIKKYIYSGIIEDSSGPKNPHFKAGGKFSQSYSSTETPFSSISPMFGKLNWQDQKDDYRLSSRVPEGPPNLATGPGVKDMLNMDPRRKRFLRHNMRAGLRDTYAEGGAIKRPLSKYSSRVVPRSTTGLNYLTRGGIVEKSKNRIAKGLNTIDSRLRAMANEGLKGLEGLDVAGLKHLLYKGLGNLNIGSLDNLDAAGLKNLIYKGLNNTFKIGTNLATEALNSKYAGPVTKMLLTAQYPMAAGALGLFKAINPISGERTLGRRAADFLARNDIVGPEKSLFVLDLLGDTGTLTDKSFSPSQKAVLQQAVKHAMRRGHTYGDYPDYPHPKGSSGSEGVYWYGKDESNRGNQIFFPPDDIALKRTLGKFTIENKGNGDVVLHDRYNFNAENTDPRTFTEMVHKALFDKKMSTFGKLRALGEYFGSDEGEGSKSRINLNLNENYNGQKPTSNSEESSWFPDIFKRGGKTYDRNFQAPNATVESLYGSGFVTPHGSGYVYDPSLSQSLYNHFQVRDPLSGDTVQYLDIKPKIQSLDPTYFGELSKKREYLGLAPTAIRNKIAASLTDQLESQRKGMDAWAAQHPNLNALLSEESPYYNPAYSDILNAAEESIIPSGTTSEYAASQNNDLLEREITGYGKQGAQSNAAMPLLRSGWQRQGGKIYGGLPKADDGLKIGVSPAPIGTTSPIGVQPPRTTFPTSPEYEKAYTSLMLHFPAMFTPYVKPLTVPKIYGKYDGVRLGDNFVGGPNLQKSSAYRSKDPNDKRPDDYLTLHPGDGNNSDFNLSDAIFYATGATAPITAITAAIRARKAAKDMNPTFVAPQFNVGAVQNMRRPNFKLPYTVGSAAPGAENANRQFQAAQLEGRANMFEAQQEASRIAQENQILGRTNKQIGINAEIANRNKAIKAQNAARIYDQARKEATMAGLATGENIRSLISQKSFVKDYKKLELVKALILQGKVEEAKKIAPEFFKEH